MTVWPCMWNRSFDAVPLWALPFTLPDGSRKIITSTLPPCIELVFDPREIPDVALATPSPDGFVFYDRSGLPWQRNCLGLVEAESGTVDEILAAPGTRVPLDVIRKQGGRSKPAQGCEER